MDASADGVSQEALHTTRETPETRLELSGVKVGAADVLGAPGAGEEIV